MGEVQGHMNFAQPAITALVLALLAGFLPAEAQQAGKVYRIGVISMRSGPNPEINAFRQRLQEMEYVEGRNVVLEIRYAGGNTEKLPGLTAEMVRLGVDVIVTQSGVAALAAREATQTIPIVMASSGDAVSTVWDVIDRRG